MLHGPLTAEEQDALERQNTEAGERAADQSYKDRQIRIAQATNELARSNIFLTIALAFFTAVAAAAGVYEGVVGKRSADAAKSAAETAANSAYMSCRQAQVARNTLIELQRQEQDAHDSATSSVYQGMSAVAAERAFIEITIDGVELHEGQVVQVPFIFKDTGHTSATNLRLVARVEYLPKTASPEFVYLKSSTHISAGRISQSVDPTREPLLSRVNIGATRSDGTSVVATSKDVSAYREGLTRAVLYARETYSDVFGVPHWMQFCGSSETYLVGYNVGTGMGQCSAYNKIDTASLPSFTKAKPLDQPKEIVCETPYTRP